MASSGSGSASGIITPPVPPSIPVAVTGRALYPMASDLIAFLGGSSHLDPEQAKNAIRSGIIQFEGQCRRTMLAGRTPANSPVAQETRAFDPPADDCSRWPGGSAEGPTLIIADVPSNTTPSIVYAPANQASISLAAGTDYILMPQDAPGRGVPWTSVLFKRRWWWPTFYDYLGAVKITGLWGYATAIYDDAWQAMLIASAQVFLMRSSLAIAGGAFPVKRWSAPGGVSQEYDTEFFSRASAGWQTTYAQVVADYMRVELG